MNANRVAAFALLLPLLVATLAAAESSLAADSAPAPAFGKQPNIVFILVDDTGYGDLSCTGNPIVKTPNIDRLHDEGVRFTDFHVNPTCSPTRSALMTGRHEFKNGVTHTIHERERLTLSATTIAQVLRSAGYTTGIFGKWHLGDEDAYQPDKRGFDEVFIHGCGGIGQTYPGSCGDVPGNNYFNPWIKHNGTFEKTDGYCTDVFFSQAEKWIDAVQGKRPFFAYIPLNAAHDPRDVRPEDEARYAGKAPPRVAKFYGMIANIDDNVGRLLDKLDAWKIDRDTLVIYMNDNGGQPDAGKLYNAGMRGSKVTAFNGGTRAASLWRWPGTWKPASVDKLTAHVDVFPTLAAIAGASLPEDKLRDGISLVPLLKDTSSNDAGHAWPDRYLVTHVGRWPLGAQPAKHDAPGARWEPWNMCSVRWREWNMVRTNKGWELFDLKSDPGERHNVAGERSEIVAQLEKHFDGWWTEVEPCLENEQAYKTAPAVNPYKTEFQKQTSNK